MAQATVDGNVVRRAGVNPWKAVPADPADYFSTEEIAKAKSYVMPLRWLARAEAVVGAATLLALAGFHVAPNVLDGTSGWVLRLIVTMAIIQVAEIVTTTGFDAYRELNYDKRWGFSTQTVSGFLSDLAKSLLIGTVLNIVLFLPLWWLIRSTELWWVYGWLFMAVLVVGIGLLGPVLIMPLFNKFTPLGDDHAELRDDLLALARNMDADVETIEVSDASRRTRKDNAFVAGAGKTRKLVLFDTLLDRPKEQIRSVAAHEIGHWKLRHVTRRSVPVVMVLLFANFFVLKVLLSWDGLLDFAGVKSLGDPAVLPLFMLLFPLASSATGLVSSYVSRASEREADIFSLETTRDPDAAAAMIRSLHTDNLADLAPSWWKRVTHSHPPAAERLALVEAWRRGTTGA